MAHLKQLYVDQFCKSKRAVPDDQIQSVTGGLSGTIGYPVTPEAQSPESPVSGYTWINSLHHTIYKIENATT
jgi:hypothetical protein